VSLSERFKKSKFWLKFDYLAYFQAGFSDPLVIEEAVSHWHQLKLNLPKGEVMLQHMIASYESKAFQFITDEIAKDFSESSHDEDELSDVPSLAQNLLRNRTLAAKTQEYVQRALNEKLDTWLHQAHEGSSVALRAIKRTLICWSEVLSEEQKSKIGQFLILSSPEKSSLYRVLSVEWVYRLLKQNLSSDAFKVWMLDYVGALGFIDHLREETLLETKPLENWKELNLERLNLLNPSTSSVPSFLKEEVNSIKKYLLGAGVRLMNDPKLTYDASFKILMSFNQFRDTDLIWEAFMNRFSQEFKYTHEWFLFWKRTTHPQSQKYLIKFLQAQPTVAVGEGHELAVRRSQLQEVLKIWSLDGDEYELLVGSNVLGRKKLMIRSKKNSPGRAWSRFCSEMLLPSK